MTSEKKNTIATFFEKEQGRLVQYVKGMFNERYAGTSAEDIIQDIALNLFDRVDFDSHIENIAGYVYRSIRNRIIDLQRKKKHEISYDNMINDENENYFTSMLVADEVPLEDYETEMANVETAYSAIDELKPDYRDIIIATEFDGYSFEELSREWEVPIGTLLSRKHRAVAQLQKIVKQKLIEKS